MEGAVFGTLGNDATHPPPGPQNFAVTTAHQREAGLHQADSSITQIVGLLGAIWDAFLAEQYFGDDAIACARRARRAHGSQPSSGRAAVSTVDEIQDLARVHSSRATAGALQCARASKSLSNGSSAAYDAPSTGGSLDQTR
ncbi:hypothetical protein [Bradyrhizobium zhanjiangense]|uniref:hypothetical protein n=1 Tax=Bradyrhizobium zhanjiangense TaxID=1325107 RepID=UPI003B83446B